MKICDKCSAEAINGVCRLCGKRKSIRDAKENDCIYVTSSNILFSRMIEDAFDDAGIKFLRKSELGSAVSIYIGNTNETYLYYVMLSDYDRAISIANDISTDITDEELEEYIDSNEECK